MVVGLEVPGDAEVPAAGVKLQAQNHLRPAMSTAASSAFPFLPCPSQSMLTHVLGTALQHHPSSGVCASLCVSALCQCTHVVATV